MAIPTNLLSTYDIGFAAGSSNKEWVYEVIQNIARFDVPWYASAPKVTVGLTTFEWLTDTLSAVATGGAQEGATFSAAARANRARKANNTQIFSLGVEVSDTQAAISPFGIRSEYDYQVMLTMREVMRNIESRAWINSGFERVVGDEASTARITASLRSTASWGVAPTSAVNGAITTGAVENLFEALYTAGGNPDKFFCSPGVKADFTASAQASGGANRMFNLAASDKRLVANVTVYEGNFGSLVVVPDIFIGQSTATADAHAAGLIDSARCQVAVLRPMKHVPIAKVGDSTRGNVITELGFIVLHASANGFLTGLTT